MTSRLAPDASGPVASSPLEHTPGYEEFMREYAGVTFNNGVYRVHSLEGKIKWNRLIEKSFSTYKGRFSVFGYDWMGRQFALDSNRREADQPLVLMFDVSYGQALQVPGTFEGFHGEVLEGMSDAVLCDDAFEEWLGAGNRAPGPTECVGFKVSPFLSGVDEFENFEVTDMQVYWELTTQIIAMTYHLPEGTPIGKITLK